MLEPNRNRAVETAAAAVLDDTQECPDPRQSGSGLVAPGYTGTDDEAAGHAARARGDVAASAEAWRRILRRHPERSDIALLLRADLRAALHYPESDPVFRRAAMLLPDEAWLEHYAALFAFHPSDLPALMRRGTELLRRRPDDAVLLRVLGDVALQQRDYAAAAEHYADARRHGSDDPEIPRKLRAARLYQRLERSLREDRRPTVADAAAAADYGVALISLERAAERRAEVEQRFRSSLVTLHRIHAVQGSHLPVPAVRRLTGDATDAAMRGTLGCFLSHAAAWESVLERGLDHCLVIEDDVMPLLDLPAGFARFGIPDGYDLCFVNDRLEPRLPAEEVDKSSSFQTVTAAEAMTLFPAGDNAPGGDGYFVSRRGARKLLDWVARDGFSQDVDWRLLAYSLTPRQCAALAPHSHAHGVLAGLQRLVRRKTRLRSYVLHPALIRTVPISSDREDENRERRPTPPS